MAVTTRSRSNKTSGSSPKRSSSPKKLNNDSSSKVVGGGSSAKDWFIKLRTPTKDPSPKKSEQRKKTSASKKMKVRAAPLRIENEKSSDGGSDDLSFPENTSELSDLEGNLSYTEEDESLNEDGQSESEDIEQESEVELPVKRGKAKRKAQLPSDTSSDTSSDSSSDEEDSHIVRRKKCPPRGMQRKPRGISSDSIKAIQKHMDKSKDEKVIYTQAEFDVTQRRKRINWTPEEIMFLRMGVGKFGISAWAEILNCPDYRFNPHRTTVDLKDKWRNMTAYREYSQLRKRPFTLLNPDHSLVINPRSGKPYLFNNKWPRDVAIKAASRDEFYENKSDICVVYVKEVDERNPTVNTADGGSKGLESVVHVYQGTRKRVTAPRHLREHEVNLVWEADVIKIREERLISKDYLEMLHV